MRSKYRGISLVVSVAALTSLSAHAGLTTVRGDFEGALQDMKTEGFESLNSTAAPLDLFFGQAARIGQIPSTGFGGVASDTSTGRFATDGGTKWWDSGGDFEITFDSAVEAFGFDWTDLGDFASECGDDTSCIPSGGLRVTFYNDNNNGAVVHQDTVSRSNGLQGFIGFYQNGAQITRVTFENLSVGLDGIGFDRLTIGSVPDAPNPTPEPSTLLLGVASLAMLMRARRLTALK